MKKVLVTGGAGFIGSHVVDLLIENDYGVVVVDDLSHGNIEYVNKKAKFYRVNICDNTKLKNIFQKECPDFVIHNAAQIDVRRSIKEPEFDAKINIVGSLNVIKCCREYGIERIVYASTGGAIYGEPQYLPVDEKHPQNPLSPYGISKLTVEKYLSIYKQIYNLDYISLRYSNVYGPRQDPLGEAGVIAIFSRKLLRNETPIINGDGEQTRDFVFVEDVAMSNLLSLRKKTRSNVFNIGSGIETSINEIYEKLRGITNSKVEAVHGKYIKGEVRNISLDCSLAMKELEWEATTNIDDGLNKTVSWFGSIIRNSH